MYLNFIIFWILSNESSTYDVIKCTVDDKWFQLLRHVWIIHYQVVQKSLWRIPGSSFKITNKLDPFFRIREIERSGVSGLPILGDGDPIVFAVPNGVDGEVVTIVECFSLTGRSLNKESLKSIWRNYEAIWMPFGCHSDAIWMPFGCHLDAIRRLTFEVRLKEPGRVLPPAAPLYSIWFTCVSGIWTILTWFNLILVVRF